VKLAFFAPSPSFPCPSYFFRINLFSKKHFVSKYLITLVEEILLTGTNEVSNIAGSGKEEILSEMQILPFISS